MRVRVEREPEPAPRVSVPAEAALDHPAVEEERGIARAEPQGLLRPASRLAAAAVAGERPREHVVAGDRGPADVGEAGELERLAEADAAVCAIERGLEVDPRAVRRLDLLDRGDEPVLLPRLLRPAGGREQVAELGDVAGERNRLDRASLERDRTAEPSRAQPRIARARREQVRNRDGRPARAGRRTPRAQHGPPTSAAFRAPPTSRRRPRAALLRRRGRAPSRRSRRRRRRGAHARRRHVHKKRCWASTRPSGRTRRTPRRTGRARAGHRRGHPVARPWSEPRRAPGERVRARRESGGG